MATLTKVERGAIIYEGISPDEVSEEIKSSIEPYQNTRSAWVASWHLGKDGNTKGIVMRTRFADTMQLHYVNHPMGSRKQITFFKDAILGAICCPNPNSPFIDTLLFIKDEGGNEQYQIWSYSFETGALKILTDKKSKNENIKWSPCGTKYAYSSTKANQKDFYLYINNFQDNSDTCIMEDTGSWAVSDFHPTELEGKALIKKYISATESRIYMLNGNTKEKELIDFSGGKPCSVELPTWSKDGKGFYFTSDFEGEFKTLFYYDLASKSVSKRITQHIPWDVSTFRIDDEGTRIVIEVNEDGISALYEYNIKSEKLEKLTIPIGCVGVMRLYKDQLAFNIDTAQTPGDIYVLDLTSRNLVRWTESEVGGLNTNRFVSPKLVHYPTFDKDDSGKTRQIPAFLYVPQTTDPNEKFPVVIYIHGGPESQFTPSFTYLFQYYLVELRIAVIAPNVRGSSGYGKKYLTLDDGYLREDSVKDIGSLIDGIINGHFGSNLDANKILVEGGSYGGYMVLASMIHFGDKLKAGIDRFGISNFITFLESTAEYRRDLRRVEYGDERIPEMREFLTKISPVLSAHKIKKPMYIVQGLNDPRVPAGESQQIADAVRKNGVDVWYLLAKDEGHGFRKKVNANESNFLQILFLKKNLFQQH